MNTDSKYTDNPEKQQTCFGDIVVAYKNSAYLYINPNDARKSCQMSLVNPLTFADGGVGWRLRYTKVDDDNSLKLIAAGILDSYDYLLSDNITASNAINRLRRLRAARKNLISRQAKEPSQ